MTLNLQFKRYAHAKGYTALELGRTTVQGKDHIWARYHMGNRDWTKKYMIVFGETEYAITATCFDQQEFLKREDLGRDCSIVSFTNPNWQYTMILQS